MAGSLDSVRQKVFRAILHAQSLEPELQGYFQTNPAEVVPEPNSSLDDPLFRVESKEPIPARFGLIVGDCLQNLRSALDYLVWGLVLAANSQPADKHMFPICKSPKVFKEELSKRHRLNGIHPDAITIIEDMQPYRAGKDWERTILWVLNEFVNINKHRRVLLTMLRGGQCPEIDIAPIEGNLWAGTVKTMPIFDENTKIRPTIVPGQLEMNIQAFAFVAFDEGAVKGMEISLCLNVWLDYILNKMLPLFERFF